MSLLLEMFTYPFIVRAFVVGILVSLCAALLGVPLVLKRYSMIGDGLSHVSFGALSIAVACGWAPLPVSIPVVILAALGLLRLTERSRMGADAAIAVVSASSLAAGVIVTSLTTGMTTDVDSYMFGSILAMDRADVALSAGLSAAVLLLFVLFYHKLFAITFDESFSRATGVRVGLYNTFLSVLTALTIVLGMRMMGAMLISSLVIFPALSAMRVRKSFRGVVILAGILAATMSTADSQLLAAASAFSENVLQDVFGVKLTSKQNMLAARLTVVVIAFIAIFLAADPNSNVFKIVSFAWAGFGATFGPAVLFALFWRRSNRQGVLAGLVAGGLMIFAWKFCVRPLGGIWDIYELMPAFVVNCIVLVVVSLATPAPEKSITDVFDKVRD